LLDNKQLKLNDGDLKELKDLLSSANNNEGFAKFLNLLNEKTSVNYNDNRNVDANHVNRERT
jgi:hypothetical protein